MVTIKQHGTLTEIIWCRTYLEKQGFNLYDGAWHQGTSWSPYAITMKMVKENSHVFTELSCSKLDQKPVAMVNKTHFKKFVKVIKDLNSLYGMSLVEYLETKELISNVS